MLGKGLLTGGVHLLVLCRGRGAGDRRRNSPLTGEPPGGRQFDLCLEFELLLGVRKREIGSEALDSISYMHEYILLVRRMHGSIADVDAGVHVGVQVDVDVDVDVD